MGRSWDPLGRSWAALGPSWAALEALLARSSSLRHPKIRREKLRRVISDDFGTIFVRFLFAFLSIFCRSVAHLGPILDRFFFDRTPPL